MAQNLGVNIVGNISKARIVGWPIEQRHNLHKNLKVQKAVQWT